MNVYRLFVFMLLLIEDFLANIVDLLGWKSQTTGEHAEILRQNTSVGKQ